MAKNKSYPKDIHEWREAIDQGLGITDEDGKKSFRDGTFPVDELANWLEKEFADDFGPNFLPALLRNIKGLIGWVYGDGKEPFWPGSDV